MGGLGASASILAAYLTSRECGESYATDDLVKLHCFAAFVVSTTEAQNRKTCIFGCRQMCEGSTSRIAFRCFQLESLILAQNERWRQA